MTVKQQIDDIVSEVKEILGLEEREKFTNDFQVNQTCMFLIVLYVFLFLYKKEVMVMVNKFLKKLK
tara:strand:- start:5097 stop:5294 length:198 start_codon:yes stop_codon:yes gene_type:complete